MWGSIVVDAPEVLVALKAEWAAFESDALDGPGSERVSE
jgi:hypothetical protein